MQQRRYGEGLALLNLAVNKNTTALRLGLTWVHITCYLFAVTGNSGRQRSAKRELHVIPLVKTGQLGIVECLDTGEVVLALLET